MITSAILLVLMSAIVFFIASFLLGSATLMNVIANVVVMSLIAAAAHRHAMCDVWSLFVEHVYANWCRCESSSMGAVLFRL